MPGAGRTGRRVGTRGGTWACEGPGRPPAGPARPAGPGASVKPGSLIALEGIDGCGKSTQARRLERALAAAGFSTLLTREPSDGPVGRRIREQARAGRRDDPEAELRAFTEDRRSHVAGVIAPALAAGRVVVTDRYYLSTVAYQGARGLDPEAILAASEREFPAPDLALVLELDPKTGLQRARGRDEGNLTAFEREEELEAVRAIFRRIDRPYVAHIDAAADEDTVHERVLAEVRRRLEWETSMTQPDLARERYVSLASFRRDGREVRTPVWIARDGDQLVVYTNRKSGKVKRIRNSSRVRLAPCDARGRLRSPEVWVDARARVRDDPATLERGLAAIQGKYGWQMALALFASRLSGRYADRTVIEVELAAS